MNDNRVENILDILFYEEDYVTVNYLAEKVGVSDKTLRSDLDKIEENIHSKNLKLIRKTGYGIRLIGTEEEKINLRNEISLMENNVPEFSAKQRMFIISALLLMGREEYYTSDFAEMLYYSRSTIHNDLLKIEKFLENFKIKLIRERNQPIKVEGRERRIRNCLVEVILKHPDIKNIVEYIIADKDYDSNQDEYILQPIDVKVSDLIMIISLMKDSDNKFINELPLQSFVTLLIYFLVSFIRYREGHMVKLSQNFLQELENRELYEEVSVICNRLNEIFSVQLPEMERRYIQVYWLSQNRDREDNKEYLETADMMANKLIASWSKQLNIKQEGQDDLLNSLKKHLVPAIIRFEQGIYFENSLLPNIKRQYTKEFKIVQKSLEQFSDIFDEPIADEEAGYLTLHILTFLEKNKPRLKVLLVSHISLGGELFIKEKIKNTIQSIEIVDTVNYFSFYDKDLTGIDLIISTISIQNHHEIPLVLINPLVGEHDLKAITNIVNSLNM